MAKYLYFVAFLTFINAVSAQQSKSSLSIEAGYIYFDLFPAEGDIRQENQGGGLQTTLLYTRSFDWGRKWKPFVGGGYSLIWPFASPIETRPEVDDPMLLHFVQLNYGVEWALSSKWSIGARGSHYIHLGQQLDVGHNRTFMNADLLIRRQLGDRGSLTITSPFSVTRIFNGTTRNVIVPIGGSEYIPSPEMNGILIGYSRNF